MRVLIACEFSGVVRDAFRRIGHDAWSCDLEDVEPQGEWSNFHLYGDALRFIYDKTWQWDLMIAHPPCTFLSSSGLHWNKTRPERAVYTESALIFVRQMLDAPIERIAVENPVGCISTRVRRPDQIIQPYEFGEDASKRTCLWLKNLPRLTSTFRFPGRMVNGRERWGNQTDGGQNKLAPSDNRSSLRSITYPGIAAAMAWQWGERP
jgi:hypothetical protein